MKTKFQRGKNTKLKSKVKGKKKRRMEVASGQEKSPKIIPNWGGAVAGDGRSWPEMIGSGRRSRRIETKSFLRYPRVDGSRQRGFPFSGLSLINGYWVMPEPLTLNAHARCLGRVSKGAH